MTLINIHQRAFFDCMRYVMTHWNALGRLTEHPTQTSGIALFWWMTYRLFMQHVPIKWCDVACSANAWRRHRGSRKSISGPPAAHPAERDMEALVPWRVSPNVGKQRLIRAVQCLISHQGSSSRHHRYGGWFRKGEFRRGKVITFNCIREW